jgi:hypothetical protein
MWEGSFVISALRAWFTGSSVSVRIAQSCIKPPKTISLIALQRQVAIFHI